MRFPCSILLSALLTVACTGAFFNGIASAQSDTNSNLSKAAEQNLIQRASKLSDEGLKLYKDGKYDEAQKVLEKGMAVSDAFAPLYYNRGLVSTS